MPSTTCSALSLPGWYVPLPRSPVDGCPTDELHLQENGTAPDYLIGAMYDTDDYLNTALGTSMNFAFAAGGGDSSAAQTVNFTRKICPYPLVARFTGGDWSTSESFVCN